ncbi:MAG TPA: OmpA family protein [Kofleriaceae bacterium]|nr:OmpA family protein [Kofleriaceae bacterium]
MRKRLAGFLLAAALAGCGPKHASFVKVDDVALGRVVIYRNGVAYYERRATVMGGALTVSVPRDRVDDFLKSLTVVDAISRKPLPVSIPRQQDDGAFLVMKLQLPTKDRADVVLTYVTESPAWKPSYRVVVGEKGKVLIEGWAIVDNTSGEDWKDVKVGVGSSSALSFRYDLWSVRQVQRTTLQDAEQFAVAPPTGMSPYGGAVRDADGGGEALIGELGDEEIRRPAGHPDDRTAKRVAEKPADPMPESKPRASKHMADDDGDYEAAEVVSVSGTAAGGRGGGMGPSADYSGGGGGRLKPARKAPPKEVAVARPVPAMSPPPPPVNDARVSSGDQKMREVAQSLLRSNKTIVIEGFADPNRGGDATRRATDRANIVRNQLIDQGVPPGRIKVVAKTEANQTERVRLVAQAPTPEEQRAQAQTKQLDLSAQPVGESHFASSSTMTVEKGASAMVSMMRLETDGEVVYLYDAESERGNANFAFRAVRFLNPTTSTLETGPVTVYGHERFIGEGLTESIPPKASAVVPYALDRQIVVERGDEDENRLSKLMTLQRGILTAQVQHIRRKKLTLTNRLREPAQVFVRHTTQKGWTLLADSPPSFERVGDAHLFKVDLKPNEVRTITISEATPIERTLDLNADVTLEMMKVYVEAPEGSPEIKEQLRKLLTVHRNLIDLAQEQDSLRRRLADYRERMDELHAQIITLQAVKTGNDLMSHLKAKMKDISDRVQKTTIALVDQEEKIMLARVRFQDTLAELTLPDAAAPPALSSTAPAAKP